MASNPVVDKWVTALMSGIVALALMASACGGGHQGGGDASTGGDGTPAGATHKSNKTNGHGDPSGSGGGSGTRRGTSSTTLEVSP